MLTGALLFSGCGDDPVGPELSGDGLLELVMVSEDLELIEGIVRELNLSTTLRTTSDLTFFAPTDEALQSLGTDMLRQLQTQGNRDALRKLVRRHLVPGRFRASDLQDGATLQPLEGPPLEARVAGETITIGDAEVTESDFETGNGVLHQVGEVVRDHLTLAERLRVTLLDGTPLAGESIGNLTYLGGSRIIVPEIETSDGLIYLLDSVVLSHLDLTERLQISPLHTLFYEILHDAGLLDHL